MRALTRGFALVLLAVLLAGCGGGERRAAPADTTPAAPGVVARGRVILATTTSTVDTGLLDDLVPVFERQTGYQVVTLSLGSGQALAVGARGDADVLLVHSPDAEAAFMQAGHGTERRLVMHNDFVLVGPPNDPAGVRGAPGAVEALRRIAAARALFVSRGDQSGTHALELKLWGQAGIRPEGGWYIESGTGMGQTLQIADERNAYTLSDRGTYLALRRTLHLDVLLEGDPLLRNIYHVILVDPSKNGRINAAGARALADFLTGPEGQRRIGEFGRERFGQPLFVPDAGKREEDLAR